MPGSGIWGPAATTAATWTSFQDLAAQRRGAVIVRRKQETGIVGHWNGQTKEGGSLVTSH